MDTVSTLTPIQHAFQHQYIKGKVSFSYHTETDCYVNILSHDHSEPVQYTVADTCYTLFPGHNVIRHLATQVSLKLDSLHQHNQLIVVVIQPENLYFFHEQYQQDTDRFENGFMTKSDTHLRLLFEQLCTLPANDLLYKIRSAVLILEMIVHQIESLAVENKNTQQPIVMKDHYEKILLAKQIIEEDLSKNHSIPELARQVGTNVQYLKKYFKQYFGKTVMSYITDKKMEYAKELILTGNYRVMDVARMTGYKHATHFTTAFKKHFGFIPNSLKYSFLLQQGVEILTELDQIFGYL